MVRREVISVSQLFSMLFISRLVVGITYSGLMTDISGMWDHVLSAGISFIATFVLVIPIYKLYSMDTQMSLQDNSKALPWKLGYIIVFIYAAYYLLVSIYTLSLFNVFISNVINPPISPVLLLVAISAAACYGAHKGFEGLARTAGLILVMIIISSIFIGISMSADIDFTNYRPFLYNGNTAMWDGVIFMLSRSSCIPAMAAILPLAKGNVKKGILTWNIGIYAVTLVVIVLMVGSLGDFLGTQLFPVYTAASVARIGPLRRLDALYLGIWTMGIFIKLTLFLTLSAEGVKRLFGEQIGKASVLWFGVVMAACGLFVNSKNISSGVFSTWFLFIAVMITSVVIPTFLIFAKYIKRKRSEVAFVENK